MVGQKTTSPGVKPDCAPIKRKTVAALQGIFLSIYAAPQNDWYAKCIDEVHK
jgi:hypothetical protein